MTEMDPISKEWPVTNGTIAVVVSPKVAQYLEQTDWAPNLADINTFLSLYLKVNSVIFEPSSQRLLLPILEHQEYIGFRLLSPAIAVTTTARVRFRTTPIISLSEGLWTRRGYMTTPVDCSRSVELYQACVLLRLDSRPLPYLEPNMTKLSLQELGCLDSDGDNNIAANSVTDANSNCAISDFVTAFTRIRDQYPSGIMCYGPAGTGKTRALKLLAQTKMDKPNRYSMASTVSTVSATVNTQNYYVNKFGFLVIFKGSGSHFEKRYVGEGEELLIKFGAIARKYPHMVCCLIVDEAEVLVADRDSHSEAAEHKKGKVAVLLDMLGGLTDIHNLVLVGATNLVASLDAAMYRRVQPIFYGRMSTKQRRDFLLTRQLATKISEPITSLTAGFTISQLSRLLSQPLQPNNYLTQLKRFVRDIHMEDGLEFCRCLLDNLSMAHIQAEFTSDKHNSQSTDPSRPSAAAVDHDMTDIDDSNSDIDDDESDDDESDDDDSEQDVGNTNNHVRVQVQQNIFDIAPKQHPLWACLPEGRGKWTFYPISGSCCPHPLNDPPVKVEFADNTTHPSALLLYLLNSASKQGIQHYTVLNSETVHFVMKSRPHNLEEALAQEIKNRIIEYEHHYQSSLMLLAMDDLVGCSVESNMSDSKTVNGGRDSAVDTNSLIRQSLQPLQDYHQHMLGEDSKANLFKGLKEKLVGTNQSASAAAQVFTADQAIRQQNASLLQELLMAQYQSSSSKTVRPLRPLVLSMIINDIMTKARYQAQQKFMVILYFKSPLLYDYVVSCLN